MKKNIIIFFASFVLVLCLTTGCQKIKYKDDFRAPFLGRYQCTVEVFNQTLRCQDHELIHKEKINMTIQIVGDSYIAIKPYSFQKNEKKMPYDTLGYAGLDTRNGYEKFSLFGSANRSSYRWSSLLISQDSFNLYINEGCMYGYRIEGKK